MRPQVVADDVTDDAKPKADGLEEVIVDAKAYLAQCLASDGGQREEQLTDLRFVAGEHWPDYIRVVREREKRPCLTVNKLPAFLHQVTNDQRMNVPGIKVSPVGESDKETTEVVQGVIRHIEYSSNADVSYDTAVNSAAAIGVGYWRLITEFCEPGSFNQEIKFRRIRNAFTVYFDPLSQEPDGSDQTRCMISSKLAKDVFRRDYPEAEVTTQGFELGTGDETNKEWVGAEFIRIAEFYRIEHEPATLIELSNGEVGFKEDLLAMPPGVTVVRSRPSTRPKTMWYKLTPFEVLESTEIKCKWIPVFPVYGDEIDLDGRVIRSGLVRNARDPAQMYNFWMTSATEEVALRPKTPYIGAEGQFEGYEDEWNSANTTSFSYLEYKPVTLDGVLAPPPQRQPVADIPNGMLAMAMHANDNIKATTGLFDSSLGAHGNATSGVQERAQIRQGDVSNFHYTDNLHRSVKHCGRCLVDMFPSYYDTQRVVRIMGEDDKISSKTINEPTTEVDETGAAVEKVLHDVTVGEYDITVKAGPAYDTLREEAADSMVEFGKSWPKLMDVAGDKVIRSMNWPGADEIAERVAKTIPPELRDDEGGENKAANVIQTPQGPIPVDQVPQMLEQMNAQMQQMGQALQDAQAGTEKAKIDADAKIKVAEINAVSASDVAELKGLVQLLVAQLQPPPQLVADAFTSPGNAPSGAPPK
jgi:hypothetical protein